MAPLNLFFYKAGVAFFSLFSFLNPAPQVTVNRIYPAQQIVQKQNQNVGVVVPKVEARFETSLALPVTSISATSMTLVNGTSTNGGTLTGYIGFTINEGASNVEDVLCDVSGTALTNCIRGVDSVDGNLGVTALAYTHRRGEPVKVTDHPVLAVATRILNGIEGITTPLYYESGAASLITSSTQLASKGYVDSITSAGAAPASESTAGIHLFATQQQMVQGIATSTYGTTTYALAPQNKYFNATSSATSTVPVTNAGGKLSSGFIDQTANYTWSGTSTFSGSSTFSGPVTFQGNTTTTFNTPVAFTASTSGVGKILQIQSVQLTTATSSGATSFADVDGLSVTITPSNVASRVLVNAMLSYNNNTNTAVSMWRLMRNSTPIAIGTTAGSRTSVTGSHVGTTLTLDMVTQTAMWVDSPATTTAVTYKIQVMANSGSTTINQTPDDNSNTATDSRGVSSIILQEIGR